MFGNPGWSKNYDYYRGKKWMRKIDITIGFLIALALWVWLFDPIWYTAPAIIIAVSIVSFILRFERRYITYGALSCVFFPLIIVAGVLLFAKGAKTD